jgi:PAS domain S-box-containing protein
MLQSVERQRSDAKIGLEIRQLQIAHPDGFPRCLEVMTFPIIKGGEILGTQSVIRDTSDQKRWEKVAHRKSHELQMITDALNGPVALIDSDGRYRFVNQYFQRACRRPFEEIVGHTPQEVLGHDAAQIMEPYLRRVFAGESLSFEHRCFASADLEDICWMNLTPEVGPDGQVIGCLAVGVDINERKQREIALAKSESLFRTLIQVVPVGIFQMDALGACRYVNEPLCQLYGESMEALLGDGWLDAIHPDDRDRVEQTWLDSLIEGKPFFSEHRILRADGAIIWVVAQAQAERDLEGEVVGFVGSNTDITGRMRHESELVASEHRFHALFEASPDGILVCDEAGVILKVNRMVEEQFGYAREELVGRPIECLMPASFREGHKGQRAHYTQRPHPRPMGGTRPLPALRKDGTEFPVAISLSHIRTPSGVQVISTIRDITKVTEAEAERRRLEAQLYQSQKMESLGSLAGGVAHDMNNVLAAILGIASAHCELHPKDSAAYGAFETITNASSRGKALVAGLLNFSRQGLASETEVDMNELIREEVALLERTTLSKVRIQMDLAPHPCIIRGDASVLSHMLMNLCVNALDAMEACPHEGLLSLRSRVQGGEVEIIVDDTGCGMSEEIRAKALDPFFTTKPQGKGTGLGLSIVYNAVKAHGGQLIIRSEPNQGTRIILRFQAIPDATQPSPSLELPAHDAPKLNGHSRLEILLVDDDRFVALAFNELIALLGHGSTHASSGERALVLLEAGFHPDVVILDMNMAGLGGVGTLPLIRAKHPELPVLLATGRVDQTAFDLVRSHSRVNLLAKPFTMKELRTALAGVSPLS